VGSVGRYQVQRVLGTGGMGIVVAAYDPELGRNVAIKLLREGGRAPGSVGGRLRIEAQALARVVHPNVVAVYDAAIAETPYLVMQLVEGETLGAYIAARQPSVDATVALFAQAGRGLAAIHAAGLIHRDFKPSNALVDGDGVVRVSDLGLARMSELTGAASAAPERITSSTLTQGIAGTPAYMAPEQLAGEPLTAACDQFGFCVSLWEAIFGERPFDGATTLELADNIKAGRIREPRGRKASPRLLRALRRGLSADPAARFPSMGALLEAMAPPRRGRWFAAAALLAAAGGATALMLLRPGAHAHRPGFEIDASTILRVTPTDTVEEFPSIGPDGTIYYDAQVGTAYHLFALDPVSGQTRELTHGDGWDLAPTISPDGTRIAFLRKTDQPMATYVADLAAPQRARRIAAGGLRPVWSPDSRYLWAGQLTTGVARYDAATAARQRDLQLPEGAYPMAGVELDDGRFVLLTRTGAATADGVVLYPAAGNDWRWLYDVRKEVGLEEVLALLPPGDAVLISKLTATNNVELWRVPVDGSAPSLVPGSAIAARKRLAINDRTVVWSDAHERTGLARVEFTAGGSRFVDLASNPWLDWGPFGVPGTDHVYFMSYRTGETRIWRDLGDGRPPTSVPFGDVEPDFLVVSPDERWIAAGYGDRGLFLGPIDGSAPPRRLVDPDGSELWASFDRAGTRLFVERSDGGTTRIASVSLDGGAPTWLLPSPSSAPAASPVADQVAYLAGPVDATVPMILDLRTGTSRPLTPGAKPYPWRHLCWSGDGKRLLVSWADGTTVELDAATGAELRRFSAGGDSLDGITYRGDEILVGRTAWVGDLWTARLR